MVIDGTQEVPGSTRGSIAGFGDARNATLEGGSPEVGTCIFWTAPFFPESSDLEPLVVTIDALGSWELDALDGWLKPAIDAPDVPLLDEGMPVTLVAGEKEVMATAPAEAVITSPDPGASVSLAFGFQVTWPAGSDEDVEVVVAAVTSGGGFRAGQNCLAADSGRFQVPAWPEVPWDTATVKLAVRRRHRSSIVADATEVELVVKQIRIRDLVAIEPAPPG
jgi:hypothetical protein